MWALFVECQKGNCTGCPGELVDGIGRHISCNCPHHHLPVAVAKEQGKVICFGCRQEVPTSELHLHMHLDKGEEEVESSGESNCVVDPRLFEVRGNYDHPPAG